MFCIPQIICEFYCFGCDPGAVPFPSLIFSSMDEWNHDVFVMHLVMKANFKHSVSIEVGNSLLLIQVTSPTFELVQGGSIDGQYVIDLS